jgi:tetratricopeptide (TPR) repeat protein
LPGSFLAGTICLLLFFVYLSERTESRKWRGLYEQSNIAMQQQKEKQEKEISEIKEKSRADTPIALRKLPLNERTGLFNEHGEILKQNSQIFLQQAEELFESENYDDAIEVYKALYNVYKDNRLAVDAVRQLSRAQKVQNVLYSMNDHIEKKQWISAQKRLEEIKHLISAENYENHLKKIEDKKGEAQ